MIRKFGRLEAPSTDVARLFADLEGWPRWMPGVRRLDVLAGGERESRVRMVQVLAGREFSQELLARTGPGSVTLRQVRGPLKRFEAAWRFQPPPDGRGTTVALELDLDLGLLGWVSPRALVQGAIDRLFEDGLRSAREHLTAAGEAAAPGPHTPASADEVLFQVFATDAGLELVVAGRRIVVPLRRDR